MEALRPGRMSRKYIAAGQGGAQLLSGFVRRGRRRHFDDTVAELPSRRFTLHSRPHAIDAQPDSGSGCRDAAASQSAGSHGGAGDFTSGRGVSVDVISRLCCRLADRVGTLFGGVGYSLDGNSLGPSVGCGRHQGLGFYGHG